MFAVIAVNVLNEELPLAVNVFIVRALTLTVGLVDVPPVYVFNPD